MTHKNSFTHTHDKNHTLIRSIGNKITIFERDKETETEMEIQNKKLIK